MFKSELTHHSRRLLRAAIILSLLALIALALTDIASAADIASDKWDKSSIELTGQCLPDGTAEFTVTNTGSAMAGPSQWREFEHTALAHLGTFQLAAGESQVWKFVSNGWPVRFEADQRPGHPGNSEPKLTLTCSQPTALTLTTFTASNAGNRGGCGRGNMTTVTCNVSDAGSGFVSGDCEYGYWFSRISTARTFRVGQVVTARGCEGLNGELYAPLRISK